MAEILIISAKIISLTAQKENVNLIKLVELIESMQKLVKKDPEVVFEFPRFKKVTFPN